MAGLTTIAAVPRTGGAGMALLGETNTRPICYPDPPSWGLFSEQKLREAISLGWLRSNERIAQQQEDDRLAVLRCAIWRSDSIYWEGM